MIEKQIRLTSVRENIDMLDSFVDELTKFIEITEPKRNRILMLLNEAVSNAMVHGNKECPEKFVTIHCSAPLTEKHICFRITDEGVGFDPSSIIYPRDNGAIIQEGGRGVHIMRQLCDDFKYENNGKTVSLLFSL